MGVGSCVDFARPLSSHPLQRAKTERKEPDSLNPPSSDRIDWRWGGMEVELNCKIEGNSLVP